jgi:CRP-like cAMP-binding protein
MTSPEHPLAKWLGQLEASGVLPDEDRRAVLDLPYRLREPDAGSYLIREGDRPTHCSVLSSGYAFRQKLTGSGSRQILAVCLPGDAVDLQNMFLDISDHSVQLLTKARIADIPRDALQEIVHGRPAVGTAIIALTLVEASILREWVVNVGRRDSRERIAHRFDVDRRQPGRVGELFLGHGISTLPTGAPFRRSGTSAAAISTSPITTSSPNWAAIPLLDFS